MGNTQADLRFTFGIRGRASLLRQHAMGALVFFLTLGLTSGALALHHALDADPSRAAERVVLVAASVCATVTRYVALRTWVFARSGRRDAPRPVPATGRSGGCPRPWSSAGWGRRPV